MHEQVVRMLEQRVAELDQERKTYIDRLAAVGFGGPLFAIPASPAVAAVETEEFKPQTAEEAETQMLRSMRNRPSDMAAAVTSIFRRKRQRARDAVAKGLHIARLSPAEIDAQLEQAEAEGKALAS
jgi:predicted house-cleaning NTP pyrophosphatase (Maf/HAM1 superfamily)